MSSLSLSPSGPGAVVPRSNRDAPLPESGKRGKRDWMVWMTNKERTEEFGNTFEFLYFLNQTHVFLKSSPYGAAVLCWVKSCVDCSTL